MVEVRRTGGFAGIARTATVRLDELAPETARAWHELLASLTTGNDPGASPAPARVPDGFTYQVRCPALGVTADLPGGAAEPSVRALLDDALRSGRP